MEEAVRLIAEKLAKGGKGTGKKKAAPKAKAKPKARKAATKKGQGS